MLSLKTACQRGADSACGDFQQSCCGENVIRQSSNPVCQVIMDVLYCISLFMLGLHQQSHRARSLKSRVGRQTCRVILSPPARCLGCARPHTLKIYISHTVRQLNLTLGIFRVIMPAFINSDFRGRDFAHYTVTLLLSKLSLFSREKTKNPP